MACVLMIVCGMTWAGAGRARAAGQAMTAEARYALIVGANEGQGREGRLKYAIRDAQRIRDVLVELGGFEAGRVQLLKQPSAEQLRAALEALADRLRREVPGKGATVVVFYSGHADTQAIHLGETSFSWKAFRKSVKSLPTRFRLLLLDACRSGKATRVKGARVHAAPRKVAVISPGPRGFATVSSATSHEDAQESDALRASFFTHHLISALRGAGDANHDGHVTLQEAYRYTASRTIASTASTEAGIQHPTYRYEMRGRMDVILTSPQGTQGFSGVLMKDPGQYLLQQEDEEGDVVLEAHVHRKSKRAWLRPGQYYVRRRTPDGLYQGSFRLGRLAMQALDTKRFGVLRYARFVRKGGYGGRAYSLIFWGGYASALLDGYVGTPSGGLGLSVEWPALTMDIVLGHSRSTRKQPEIVSLLDETTLGVGARKVFDVGIVSLSAGIRVGLSYMLQHFETMRVAPTSRNVAPSLSTLVRADVNFGDGFFLASEGYARLVALSSVEPDSGKTRSTLVQWGGRLGLGKQW